jgi:hypothetical protein
MSSETKCVYNKKATKFFSCAVCYYCLSSYDTEELKDQEDEELICLECNQKTIIPVSDDDDLTLNWISDISMSFHKPKGK